jgi:hypothetical protein
MGRNVIYYSHVACDFKRRTQVKEERISCREKREIEERNSSNGEGSKVEESKQKEGNRYKKGR